MSPPHGRILVVDDEQDIRTMLALVLSLEGWRVDDARDGASALAYTEETAYDVVVLDHRMPGLTGVEVARELVARGFPGTIVLFSAYVDATVEAECRELGVAVVDKMDWYALVDACSASPALVAS